MTDVRVLERSRSPPWLRAIYDPPQRLYLRGASGEDLLGRRTVAVVGARACSPYGAQVARRLGRELAAAGLVVVSGLARGIDGEGRAMPSCRRSPNFAACRASESAKVPTLRVPSEVLSQRFESEPQLPREGDMQAAAAAHHERRPSLPLAKGADHAAARILHSPKCRHSPCARVVRGRRLEVGPHRSSLITARHRAQ